MSPRPSSRRTDGFAALPMPARTYMAALFAVGAVAASASLLVGWGPELEPGLLVLLVLLGAAGAAFETFAPGHYALQPNYVFLFWGAVLLPPWAVVVLAIACFAPSARGIPLYKTAFNVVNFALTGFLVSAIATAGGLSGNPAELGPAGVAALMGAAVVGAAVNHAMVVVVITLAGEQPLRRALPQLAEGLPISVGVGLTGACLLLLWATSPWLVAVGIGPLALVYRSLWVPMLRHRADTDDKTGLYNLTRFQAEFEVLLADARRRRSPFAVGMLDLDHLRTINNEIGHLAGDRAIKAVADALARLAERVGVAARFGGEEFAVVLPGRTLEQAQGLLEEVLAEVSTTTFRAGESEEPLPVSFSAGVACYPVHGTTMDELIEAADQACYAAKAAGRARVELAVAQPQLEHAA